MKTIYIPKGETVTYETLSTENLVVKGCLHVQNDIRARHISGDGILSAGSISADVIRAAELESANITCKQLIAKRVCTSELIASESAAVSCYLTAAYVKAGKLTVAASDVDQVDAEQIVNLPVKKRSLLGTLLASALRSFWLGLTTPPTKAEVMDAPYEPVQETAEDVASPAEALEANASDTGDFELQRIIAQFKLARETGYTLRLIPGAPEDNAPVFDFAAEQILRPAA